MHWTQIAYTLNPCGEAKELHLIFTVITGEVLVHIDCANMFVDVRKSCFYVAMHAASVCSEACMVCVAGSSKTMEVWWRVVNCCRRV